MWQGTCPPGLVWITWEQLQDHFFLIRARAPLPDFPLTSPTGSAHLGSLFKADLAHSNRGVGGSPLLPSLLGSSGMRTPAALWSCPLSLYSKAEHLDHIPCPGFAAQVCRGDPGQSGTMEIPQPCHLLAQGSEARTTFLGWHADALLLISLLPKGEAHQRAHPCASLPHRPPQKPSSHLEAGRGKPVL